jgi:hypothetical protein
VIRFCSLWLVWWANSSPFSHNAAVRESVVHLNFISCFKCCLLCLKSVHVFTSWKQKYTKLLKSSIDISCISHFYRFTVMDTSFHASENDFICKDCGKCLKSRSGLRRHRLRQHLKQEITFKCTTDSCTAAFCEKGELLAHQTNHGEQKLTIIVIWSREKCE